MQPGKRLEPMTDAPMPSQSPDETPSERPTPLDPGPAPAEAAPWTPATEHELETMRPRSIRRRLERQAEAARPQPPRIRSQPLTRDAPPQRRVREPVPLDWEPEPMTGPWRARSVVVTVAVLGWFAALALLLSNPVQLAQVGIAPRLLVPVVWALAAGVTFVPVQFRLGIPGVGWQAMLGFGLLGYLLAFVPAPTGSLLELPDVPVYLLLFFAVFYAAAATTVPLTYLFGQRFYKLRIHRLDVGRARRQAYEIGLLIVITLGMAGLRVLSPITFGLLVLVIVLTETLLLSQVQPEG